MIELNEEQKEILEKLSVDVSESFFVKVCSKEIGFDSIETNEQLGVLIAANAMYRSGVPCISDKLYDEFHRYFKAQNPHHEFVQKVEPELITEGKTVLLPVKMLSTDKAYSLDEIKKWINRIKKAAADINMPEHDIFLRVSPKLDGYAAYDDGSSLYTRGDGVKGRDISFVFERGLKVFGSNKRGLGQGEIVISREYFKKNLSKYFENSRNIQAAIIAEKNIDERVQEAIDAGAVVFCPFSELKHWEGRIEEFLSNYEKITSEILKSSEFDIDGIVIEVKNPGLKDAMGATRHHHRWQIALKSNDETAEVEVKSVIPQTSRNGKITPVVQFKPTRLSGAELSRVTAHHYGMVKEKGIGKGAIIRIVRSGLVIPKIEEVVEPAIPEIPKKCPSCHSQLQWIDDNLFCLNTDECKDQIEKTIIHFFDTLGNNDGFGASTVATLHKHGYSNVYEIYQLEKHPEKLAEIGYKEKTVKNLMAALYNSRNVQIEDWRFLAAFGVNRLGLGVSEKLLQHHRLETIFDLTVDDLTKIDGFAEITASQVVNGLRKIKDQFDKIYDLKFNLDRTPLVSESKEESADTPITGKQIVFTGTMTHGKRSEMQAEAKKFGAKVGSSVTGKTDFLVTGAKVGASKIETAKKKGIKVLTEDEYLAMLKTIRHG